MNWDTVDHVVRTTGPDEADDTPLAVGRVGTRPQLTVTFRQRDGTGLAFSYAHLYRVASVGQGKLTVEFSEHVVTVEGRNLGRLLRALCDHRLREVWECDRDFADDQAEVVQTISVADRRPTRS